MAVFAMLVLPAWGQGPTATFTQVLRVNNLSSPKNTVKLTWVGLQSESVATVAFAVGSLPDLSIFTPYRTPGIFYHNDDAGSDWLFTVTDAELNQVLVNLSQVPAVVAGGVQGDMVSLSVYLNTGDPNNPFVYEVILDGANADLAAAAIAAGLDPGNPGQVHIQTLQGVIKGS